MCTLWQILKWQVLELTPAPKLILDPILDCIAEEDEEIELEDEEVAAVTTTAAADSEEEQLPKKKKKKKRKKLKAADDILDFAANPTCAEAWSYFRTTE